MSNYPTDPSRPRGGIRQWLARIWAAIRNRGYPADLSAPLPVLDPRITVNHTSTLSFSTPSRSDSYEFSVSVQLCWCATGTLPSTALLDKIKSRVPEMDAEITAAVRPVARQFAPYRADLAEVRIVEVVKSAVESALAAIPDTDGVVLSCTPRSKIDPAPEIREIQRKYVVSEMDLEARYRLSGLAAEHLGELRVIWRDFINEGLPEWNTPYAISLALRYDEAAKVLFGMRADRRDEAEGLVETIAQVASGHDRLDLLEFAVASDSALRKTYELLGIPLPPDRAVDSLFSAGNQVTNGSEES